MLYEKQKDPLHLSVRNESNWLNNKGQEDLQNLNRWRDCEREKVKEIKEKG